MNVIQLRFWRPWLMLVLIGLGGSLPASQITLWTAPTAVKVFRDTKAPASPVREISLTSARNEWESFQIVLTPTVDVKAVRIKVMDFIQASGKGLISRDSVEIYEVGHVPIRMRSSGLEEPLSWPDPLLPHTRPVDLEAVNGNQPFWVTVRVPEEVLPGAYSGAVHLVVGGEVAETLPIRLLVRPFLLPSPPSFPVVSGLSPQEVGFGHGVEVGSEPHRRLMGQYFLFLANRRLIPTGIPAPIDSPEAGLYLRDPRFRRLYFPLSLSEISRDSNVALLGQLSQSKDLDRRVTFCLPGETQEEGRSMVKLAIERMKTKLPGARVLVLSSPLARLLDRVDVWAPSPEEFEARTARQLQTTGREVWWRLTGGSRFPHLLIDEEGIEHRLLPWMACFYHIDGLFLDCVSLNSRLSASTKTRQAQDIWSLPMTEGGNGSEFLVYPTIRATASSSVKPREGPVSSLRLELLREGLEDLEYLNLLAGSIHDAARRLGSTDESFDRSRVRELCSLAVQDMTHFTRDPDKLLRLRARVAEEIESLSQKEPVLLVRTNPSDFATVSASNEGQTVEGVATPGSTVRVAGQPISTDSRGRFKAKVYPLPGINRITIEASKGGHVASATRTLTVLKATSDKPAVPRSGARTDSTTGLPNEDSETRAAGDRVSAPREASNTSLARQPAGRAATVAKPVLSRAVLKPVPSKPGNPLGVSPASPTTANPLYLALKALVKRHLERGETDLAKSGQNALQRLAPRQDPRGVSCKAEAGVFLKKWGFRLSNGVIEAIIWRQGARIVQLKVAEIPLLHQPHPDAVLDNQDPREWHDLGGYVEGGKRFGLTSLENWNLVVTEQSVSQVALEARQLLLGGRLKLRRSMTLRKGDNALMIRYVFSNQTDSELSFPWSARIDPGIGFSASEDRGNPWRDRIVIPTASHVAQDYMDPDTIPKAPQSQTLRLNSPFVASFDSVTKTALVVVLPVSAGEVILTVDTRQGVYSFEPGIGSSSEGLRIPPHSQTELQLKLIGLIGVSTPSEITNKFGQR
ncbi:MAG: DUF4091 domain-containing protein [Armatimonadetes bacterium]|nr:DUF4091 domain-containing protein [Armatimonadota bacterium]